MRPPYTLLKVGEVMPGGWIAEQLRQDLCEGITGAYSRISDNVNQNLFAAQSRQPGTLVLGNRGMKEKDWWAGEHEGYWGDALLRTAILTGHQQHLAWAEKWVADIVAKAEETGYIGIYDEATRFPDRGYDGELWTQSRVFQALLAWYEYKGDERVLAAVIATVRKTIEHYRKTTYFGRPGADGGVAHGVGYIDTLEWLYRLTTDTFFADAVLWLYNDLSQSGIEFVEFNMEEMLDADKLWHFHTPHIAEALHMPAIVAFLTGDEDYRKAADNVPHKLARHTNPGGGFVAGTKLEAVCGTLGDGSQMNEYCSKTEAVQSLNRSMLYTGDTFCGAWIEKCVFNAAQGARFHPGLSAVIYLSRDNRLNADDEKLHNGRELFSGSHKAAACCTLNAMRLMPYYVEGMWLRTANGRGLFVNLYGASTVHTQVDGIPIRLEEETDYPTSDKVVFKIAADKPVRFELLLRVPENSGSVVVNAGERADVQQDGNLIRIAKEWKTGDTVKVDFDFQIVLQEQVAGGQFYYQWGPLVFSLPFADEIAVLEQIRTNGGNVSTFYEYAIRAGSDKGWGYRLNPNASNELVFLSGNKRTIPWKHPPIGLTGSFFDEHGAAVETVLYPMGSTILRRTTFPVHDPAKSVESGEDRSLEEKREDDPMRYF